MPIPAFVNGDIVQFTVVVNENEQTALLNFRYEAGISTGGSGTEFDSAVAFDTMIAPLIKPVINNNATYRGTLCQKIWPLPIPARAQSTGGVGAGTSGATALPRQTAGLTTWRSSLAKQANRGRTYWPFPSTTSNSANGLPLAGYQGALVTMATAIRTLAVLVGPTGGDFCVATFGIFHKATHGFTPIESSTASAFWATQKRRGSYGKANVSPL